MRSTIWESQILSKRVFIYINRNGCGLELDERQGECGEGQQYIDQGQTQSQTLVLMAVELKAEEEQNHWRKPQQVLDDVDEHIDEARRAW